MRILGVDPGLRLTGYGCVDDQPAPSTPSRAGRHAGASPAIQLVEAGVIRLNAKQSISDRLAELDHDFRELVARLRPDLVAVEMLYAHYKHPTTAIVMGHARGVLLLAIRSANLPLVELRPTEIKKSLTGHGHASKEQMQEGVRIEMGLAARPEPSDVADALAIALCATRRRNLRAIAPAVR